MRCSVLGQGCVGGRTLNRFAIDMMLSPMFRTGQMPSTSRPVRGVRARLDPFVTAPGTTSTGEGTPPWCLTVKRASVVLLSGGVDFHAVAKASRFTSEQNLPSRPARATGTAISYLLERTTGVRSPTQYAVPRTDPSSHPQFTASAEFSYVLSGSKWWARPVSNRRPPRCKRGALAN